MIGAHVPTSGGIHKALLEGQAIGSNTVQIFTASPRMWQYKEIKAEDIALFRKTREEIGYRSVISHDSYLINLAAPDEEVLDKSKRAFRAELNRADSLGINWVVTHMGAHLNKGEDAAVQRLIESLKQILDETDTAKHQVGIALETTAGQGSGLGWRFEQLGEILKGVGEHPRLGVCLDTCHIFVAGYDIRSEESYEATFAKFDAQIGLEQLQVLHCNDTKKPLGSRVDRHEHIGEGEIGEFAFRRLVNDSRLYHVPIIVETPDSDTMHEVNVARLKSYLS